MSGPIIAGFGGMGFGTRNRRWSWWGGFQLGQERSPWHQQRECGEKNSSVHMGRKVSTKRRKISTNFTKYEEEVGVSRVSGFWVFPSETPWSLGGRSLPTQSEMHQWCRTV